ncbi:Rho guanine nucleotide exchange factor, putative [Hondaea fermentalgiana]|uniref:Rho guanine nucleotide exchange factor, putative n=1 Tax=Hondaea fermentalgiana TaxID=2315210 RepID=A0A2R5G1R4_9STRA|nr:Rho guanine nucleotide exchange factor, putative [Hondaea fermentalgiana]|eukprot:GBG24932.1 Rho guanine nucleotide exchange factor, putative [Hondaea fermentalgiana]
MSRKDLCDPELVEWARCLRCPSADLAKPGRRLLMETAELTNRKKNDVHLLVCSDVLLLSQLRKKSTFSRRKPELVWIETGTLHIDLDPAKREVTLNPDTQGAVQLICPDDALYAKLGEVLQKLTLTKAGDRSQSSRSIIDPDAARPRAGTNDTGVDEDGVVVESKCAGKRQPSNSSMSTASITDGLARTSLNSTSVSAKAPAQDEETALIKTTAVFERMIMWAGAGNSAAAKTASSKQSKDQVQSIKVFRELLDTELTYVQDIRKLVTEYIKPLREEAVKNDGSGERLISHEDLALIFNNVENILEVNAELLQSLQTGLLRVSRNGDIPSLCEVAGVFAKEFVRVVPFFKMYWVYCHQYSAALERLTSLREANRELGHFLQRREARKKNAQASLQHLLIKPVQRICKYPLLFRELLNHMKKIAAMREEDTDFHQHVKELCHAEKVVQDIADMVNTRVSEAENQDQVMKVYVELGGESGCPGLLTPSRRFVRTEDVLMREAPYSENKRARHRMYIFNDLVIFARVQTTGTLGKVGTLGRKSGMMGSLTTKGKSNLRVVHSFGLDECRGVKKLNVVDEDGRSAFELRRVSRVERMSKTNSLTPQTASAISAQAQSQAQSQTMRLSTQIQRFEIWCDAESTAEGLMTTLTAAHSKFEESNETRETAKPDRGKARAWASRAKPRGWRQSIDGGSLTREAIAQASSVVAAEGGPAALAKIASSEETPEAVAGASAAASSSEGEGSHLPAAAAANSTSAAAVAVASAATVGAEESPAPIRRMHSRQLSSEQQKLSLEMMKSRYEVAPRLRPEETRGGTVNLDVEFPDGPLGIALENSKQPKGVLVACVAGLSVAERGGIALGDRVTAVGGNAVPIEATWDQVVDIIKSLPRPLVISFERTAETVAAAEAKKAKSTKRTRKSSSGSVISTSTRAGGDDEISSAGSPSPNAQRRVSSSSSTNGSVAGGNSSAGARTGESDSQGAPRTGQRQWAAKLDRRKASMGTTRLLSLKELEACYNAAVAATEEDEIDSVFGKLDKTAASESDEKKRRAMSKTVSVLREMYVTEKGYVCDLRKIIGEYMLPLRQTRPPLESDDEQAIFLNVEGILKINAELLKNLQAGVTKLAGEENLPLEKVVAVFTHELQVILPFLKIYSTYCHRYAGALARLVSCRQSNKQLDAVVKQREARPENQHHSLQSLLIKPVQRICKYPLLVRSLQEAVGALPNATIDASAREELDRAAKAVEAIAAQVNKKVSDAENIDRVLQIYKQLGGATGCPEPLVEPHRRFVSEDEVQALTAPFHEGKAQTLTLFLFNDLLLLAELKKRNSGTGEPSYKLQHTVDLRNCDAKALPAADDVAFQITQVTRNVCKQNTAGSISNKVSTCIAKFRIGCSSKEMRDRLLGAVAKEIDALVDVDTASGSMSSSSSSKSSSLRSSSRADSLRRGTAGGGATPGTANKRSWNATRATGGKLSLDEMKNRYNRNATATASAAP